MDQKKAAGAAVIVYWLGAVTVGFFLVHGAAYPGGGAPLSTGLEQKVLLFSGAQENWQFFEKDLKADHVLIARREGGRWAIVSPSANAEPKNLFGVSRRPRKDAVERNRLVAFVKKEDWVPCAGELDACIEAAQSPITITNPAPNPAYCGSFAIVRREQIPWAWASAPNPTYPTFVVRMEAKC
jgi:antimicrobial peptide system SdpA family protein